VVVAAGLMSSLLVIAQAWLVTDLVLAALRGEDLTTPALWVVALLALRGAVTWLGDLAAAAAAARVGTALRARLLGVATHRDAGSATGELTALVTRGVSAAEPYLTRYLPAVVLAGVLPALTVVVIVWQDLLSGIIVVATLPLIPIFGALVGLATRDRAREQWQALASLSGHFVDVMRGLPTLVAFCRARVQTRRIAAATDRYRRASVATLRLAFASSAVLELVATLSVALVAVTVGVRLAEGTLDLRTALVVLLLAPEAYWPLRRVGAEFHAAAEGVATFEAAHALLEGASMTPQGGQATDIRPVPRDAVLVLDEVSVTYPGRGVPALAPLTALLPARGVTVVTGPSGCGKSTLLAVVAGLMAPSAGRVLADGAAVGGESWRSQVAWLPQRPAFVSGTIADNLRLADPTASDERLWAALRRVALDDRVRALSGGLACMVGEDGTTLSAGERARLALARVVLSDRPWALLDEPTAHLDPLTERVIARTVRELGEERSVVMVAHRPAMVALGDRVLRLEAAAQPTPATSAPALSPPATRRPAATATLEEPVEADGASPRRELALSTVLGALASLSGVALTATAGWLIVQASTMPGVLTLLVAIVGVRTFGLARPVLRYAERLRSHDAALRLLARRRVAVYEAVVPLTPARLGRRRGDMLASIVDDVDSVLDRELRVRLPARSFWVVAGVAAVVAAAIEPLAGLVVLAGCLAAGSLAWALARAGARRAQPDLVAARAELSAAVLEAVQVAEELKMWQAEDLARGRVVRHSHRIGRDSLVTAAWWGSARAWVLLVTGVAVAVAAVVARDAHLAGTLSGPMLALLVLTPLALADVALPLADAGALSVRTEAATARLDALARTEPAVRDPEHPAAVATSEVDVRGARARWDDEAPLTAPATFDLRPGDRVGVVGPSGSGKSTLAAVLLRFLDPAEGEVRLGGTPTRDLAADDVRRRVGLVDDDPHVFATTVVENIRLARPEADDADVERALRRAHLGPWLDGLPGGLDTWLGDGHAGVSGGERARLGIARTLLADQPVLVLDEPAAHLDVPTAEVLAAEVLAGDRDTAVLWITHTGVGLDRVDRVVDLGSPGSADAYSPDPSSPGQVQPTMSGRSVRCSRM